VIVFTQNSYPHDPKGGLRRLHDEARRRASARLDGGN